MTDTFYLKYRPQKVSSLDLKDVREKLEKILSSERIPHAFLFAGPKGLGKTSAARIVAKSVNCLAKKKGGFEPCGKCENCKSIAAGTALDLVEIDAASNRGIDDIRQLRERIKLSPSKMKKKIYVIDEVHMLTTEAFNALLKTLEEPPEHALFILCTTEVHKLPETVKSRCLLLNFYKANTKELIRSLKRVVKNEGLKAGKNALVKIAARADGSFRDATKILEQLSFEGKSIKEKNVDSFFKESALWGSDFFYLLEKKDSKKLLQVIEKLVKGGADLKDFSRWILEVLRAMLLLKFEVEPETEGLRMSKGVLKSLNLETQEIKKLIDIFDKASRQLKSAVIPQLPLELAICEWSGDREMGNGKWEVRKLGVNSQKRQGAKKKADLKIEDVEKKWPDFLAKIKKKNHSIEALLKSSRPTKIDGDRLVIEVFYEFHKGRLEGDACMNIVYQTIVECFDSPFKVKYVLGERNPVSQKKESNIKYIDDEELIKSAEEIFGGK